MTNKVFEKFTELFKLRCDNYALLNFGEDSVRYDFFCAISEILKLEPWQIQLEYAMNNKSYTLRGNANSKRKEKPMLDLIVDYKKTNICVEFGLFRQNSNEKGNINKTNRTIKMVNDMIRLSLESHYSKRDAYFVCVADEKMLNHQLRSKLLGKFPTNYLITTDTIHEIILLKSGGLDLRFITKFNSLKSIIKANLIYEAEINARKTVFQTKILIWEVILEKDN